MASIALRMRFMNTCWSCTRSAVILGRSGASSVRVEIEYWFASPRSITSISRTISFTSTNSRCGGDFLYNERRRSMISVARAPSFAILPVDEALEATGRIAKDGARATQTFALPLSLYKKSPPQRELVDVNEIVREMLVMLRGEANQYSISTRTELAPDLPKITADRVQLQQVFMNLILNAIEAMKDTAGELTIKTELSQGGQLLISVSDTGVGLPDENTDQIFKAFFTTKPQGTGMGLAISRSIVESHGGRLWASANNGRGATFQLTLPAEVKASSPSVA